MRAAKSSIYVVSHNVVFSIAMAGDSDVQLTQVPLPLEPQEQITDIQDDGCSSLEYDSLIYIATWFITVMIDSVGDANFTI